MTDKGLMIQCLKNKHINIDEMTKQNYILFDRITKAMNEYHQVKLKLFGIADVVSCVCKKPKVIKENIDLGIGSYCKNCDKRYLQK
jgi:hypothetical protein